MEEKKYFIFVLTKPDRRFPYIHAIDSPLTPEDAMSQVEETFVFRDGFEIREKYIFDKEYQVRQRFSRIANDAKEKYINMQAFEQ